MSGAVELIGYTTETFDEDAGRGFEAAVAQMVEVEPGAVQVVTVGEKDQKRRRLTQASNAALGIRVDFAINASDAAQAATVNTVLQTTLQDNPESFIALLHAHGLLQAGYAYRPEAASGGLMVAGMNLPTVVWGGCLTLVVLASSVLVYRRISGKQSGTAHARLSQVNPTPLGEASWTHESTVEREDPYGRGLRARYAVLSDK